MTIYEDPEQTYTKKTMTTN